MVDQEKVKATFELACKRYDYVKDIVKVLSDITHEAIPEFTFKSAMVAYDIMLQAALLNAAMEDNYYTAEERAFIDGITDCGDLMNYINSKAGTTFSWDNIVDYTPAERKDIALKIASIVDELADVFVPPFALADKVITEYNFCEEIIDSMNDIVALLCIVDGDDIKSACANDEYRKGAAIITVMIENRWKKYKK